MKIFVSYSRRDAGDFAYQINSHLSNFNYDIFTDVDDIRGGDVWSKTIEENISNCDIFVVIVTYGALHSPHVEREVLQAQRENKTIIPCFHKDVLHNDIKWELEKIQGVEFDDKYELARHIRSKISRNQDRGRIFGSTSKTVKETKTNAPTTIKSDIDRLHQNKDRQSSSNLNSGTTSGSNGVPYYPKDDAPKYDNNERNHIRRDSTRPSHGINLKLLIIPIMAVAIIGIIVYVSYVYLISLPDTTETVTPSNDTSKLENTTIDLKQESTLLQKNPPLLSTKISINASSDVLSNIEYVEYYLHTSFDPNTVKSSTKENNFLLTLQNYGTFDLKAKVFFKDGTVKDLELPRSGWTIS